MNNYEPTTHIPIIEGGYKILVATPWHAFALLKKYIQDWKNPEIQNANFEITYLGFKWLPVDTPNTIYGTPCCYMFAVDYTHILYNIPYM